MSKLLEFLLGSILIAIFTVGLMFFSVLQYVLKADSAADCAWHGSARAWIDSNGDGFVNNGESPFRNVEIHVEEVVNQLIPFGDAGWTAMTDKDGDVQFNIPIPKCVDTAFQIYADIPTGYRITTKPRVAVNSGSWQTLDAERIYYFGFVLDR